ncbi:hypothetical protein [Kitasatospora indigofera]|uniref:hypothetical protein n=1 Tax=Kitasatospora indigofera TaxID=67307 RepID=UPI0033B07DB0
MACYVRTNAELAEWSGETLNWAFGSAYHFVLEHGRLFAPRDLPYGIDHGDEGFCYTNASDVALRHRGLLYVEGFATVDVGGGLPIAHGWCVNPDGAVADPTWPDGTGLAFFGVPIADRGLWPHPVHGGGILQEPRYLLPLLRQGLTGGAVAELGRVPAAAGGRSGAR